MTIKLLCTLGPSSLNPKTIERLNHLNVDLFRLNLSHTPVAQIEPLVNLIRAYSSVPVSIDTQGAQVRTGSFSGNRINLATGSVVTIVPSPAGGDATTVSIYPSNVLSQLEVNDLISVDLNGVLLQIIDAGPPCIAYTVNGGAVGENKAVSIVGKTLDLPPLTESDYAAIKEAVRLDIPQIALSFANRPSDVELMRSLIGPETQIIAKIESQSGVKNLAGILEIADAILIDRGDLSREVEVERLPYMQKEIIQSAKSAGVPVYVATNLLESMVTSPAPTRAEVNDVINTLMDGADGLVLAAETAIGDYPVECATMIQRLIRQFETPANRTASGPNVSSASGLVAPHGGILIENTLSSSDSDAVRDLPKLELDEFGMTDVRQIAIGTYSPLDGFMNRDQLESVLATNRLPNGLAWTMPILLQLPASITASHSKGDSLAITHNGEIQALLDVDESFTY